MKSKKSPKSTTSNPYFDDNYIYGDDYESYLYSKDWLFFDSEYGIHRIFELIEITETLEEIYRIACFFSFFINLFHLFVLSQKELRSNLVYIIMIGICLCDIAQSSVKMIQMALALFEIEGRNFCAPYSHVMTEVISRTIIIMNRQSSSFLVFFIAAYRAFSVIFPMSNWSQLKPKTGFLVIFFSILVSLIWSCVYFFQTTIEKVKECYNSEPLDYIPYKLVILERWETKYLLFDGILSISFSFLYLFVAISLLIAILKNRKRRKSLKKEKESNPSMMIIFLAISVFIAQSAYGVLYLVNYFVFQRYEEQELFESLNPFTLFLFILNSAIHAIICFAMSSQYRDTVKRMICRKKEVISISEPSRTLKVSSSTKKTY
uniref:G_PROTEIN_RECEP_F1_2 domain-containing protein n=3 Tax=Caenorhabditis tropicalis TaxID=1561998 RepID=A0A1I7UF49_9PELO